MEQLTRTTQSLGQDAGPSLDLQHVGAGRYFVAAILGVLFSLLVFSLLATLTKPGDVSLQQMLPSVELDLLLVRNESDLELRQRRRPPAPEEPASIEEFVAMPMQPVQNLNVEAAQLQFDVPDINVGLAVDLSPALRALSQNSLSTQMFAVDIPLQQNLKALKDVPPRYPSRAQRKKIEGQLLAEFLVDESGYVKSDSIKFIEAQPPGVFENSVLRSLKRSRFEPMQINGAAVVYRARKTYTFLMPK